jgi:hypothetical protein
MSPVFNISRGLSIFRRVCKIAESDIGFVMTVYLSVCLQLGSHWTDFREIWAFF